jgi:hypothetical protein
MLEKLLRWELQLEWHNAILAQGCTNPGRQIAAVSTFCTVVPKICGPYYGTYFMSPFWYVEF